MDLFAKYEDDSINIASPVNSTKRSKSHISKSLNVGFNDNGSEIGGSVFADSQIMDGSQYFEERDRSDESTNGIIQADLTRYRSGVALDEHITLGASVAGQIVKLGTSYNDGLTLSNDELSGNKFIRQNNAIYRDFPEESIVKSDRYRLADAYGEEWLGPIRSLGMLRQVNVEQELGYIVDLNEIMRIPDFKSKIMYPLGSASVNLKKTFNPNTILLRVGKLFARRSVDLDISVSTLVQAEGRFLRNVVSSSEFTHDILEMSKRVIDENGSFLGANIDAHRQKLISAIISYCCKKAPYAIYNSNDLIKLLPIIAGSYNLASYGKEVRFLNSKPLPDPIKVGNKGDSQGGMAADEGEAEEDMMMNMISSLGSIEAAANVVQQLKTQQASSQIPTNPNPGMPTYGWGQLPPADGGKVWNLTHLQASNWIDGQLIHAPGVNFMKDVRACWFDERVVNDLMTMRVNGTGTLVTGVDDLISRNYVFLPSKTFSFGDEDLIRQDGVEINLIVDRYDPELDEEL